MLLAAALGLAAPVAAGGVERPGPGEVYYVDRELASEPRARPAAAVGRWQAKPAIRRSRPARTNALHRALAAGFEEYLYRFGGLPQIGIAPGPALRPGDGGERVRRLRERLGLYPQGGYDLELEEAVRAYQAVHGLPADGIAGARTLASLNLGAAHYVGLIRANIARAAALPADLGERYILVDAAAARLWMYEDDRPVDSMKVIVGRSEEQTPMMAALIRYAVVNPYWNVPPDLVERRIAPNVLSLGLSYLEERGYEALSDWSEEAEILDPASVDWEAVAAGRQTLRVRQRPGPGNVMGDIKFMLPNRLGIYLHDTPDRDLFESDDRRKSSGCVRLEDAQRLSRWLFGRELRDRTGPSEHRVDLDRPVPVYITYFTAAPSDQGIVFREDVYDRDSTLLATLGERMETAAR